MGGAVVQEVSLVINGEVRTDIRPRVVRHWQGITPQVGSVFPGDRQLPAHQLHLSENPDPQHGGFFAAGRFPSTRTISTAWTTRPESTWAGPPTSRGLVGNIHVESPGEVLRADGEEQLVFVFDLSQEPRVESVQLEAFLGNDFLVEVALLSNQNPRGKTYNAQYPGDLLPDGAARRR